jgi:hypothetical protein
MQALYPLPHALWDRARNHVPGHDLTLILRATLYYYSNVLTLNDVCCTALADSTW